MTSRITAQYHDKLGAVRRDPQALARRRRLAVRVAGLMALLAVAGVVTGALLSARPVVDDRAAAATPFTLPTSDGGRVSLADYTGRPVVLYFSEGAGCDACIQQMAAIEQDPAFAQAGIAVLPIVMNSADQINAEAARFGVRTPWAIDDGTVSAAYGTLGTGMHAGLPGHGFALIDADGVQRWSGNFPSMWLAPGELLATVQSHL